MNLSPYFVEEFSNAHHQGLLEEAARGRLLASLIHNHRDQGRRAAGKFEALLARLGMRLERSARCDEQIALDL
jgi:hypothetical protein